MLRNVSGMELKDFIHERLAKPQGWGEWNYCLYRGDVAMKHANGAGSTALHATDVMRFGWCLAQGGKWISSSFRPITLKNASRGCLTIRIAPSACNGSTMPTVTCSGRS